MNMARLTITAVTVACVTIASGVSAEFDTLSKTPNEPDPTTCAGGALMECDVETNSGSITIPSVCERNGRYVPCNRCETVVLTQVVCYKCVRGVRTTTIVYAGKPVRMSFANPGSCVPANTGAVKRSSRPATDEELASIPSDAILRALSPEAEERERMSPLQLWEDMIQQWSSTPEWRRAAAQAASTNDWTSLDAEKEALTQEWLRQIGRKEGVVVSHATDRDSGADEIYIINERPIDGSCAED